MTTPVHCFVFNVIPTGEYDYYHTSVQVNHPVPGMYHVNSLAKGSSPMFIKKAGPLVAGAAIAIATVTAVAPTAGAAERVSAERQVTFTCLGTGSELSTVSPNAFEVTYPEEVAPGEIFTVSVQPGAMRNNARAVNRMTFDYALPTNATILGLNLAGKCDWSLRCGALGGTSQSAGQDHQCHRYGGTDLGRRVGALRHQHLHYRHRRNLCCGEHRFSAAQARCRPTSPRSGGRSGDDRPSWSERGAYRNNRHRRIDGSAVPAGQPEQSRAMQLRRRSVRVDHHHRRKPRPCALALHHHPRGWTAHPGPEPADTVHCQSLPPSTVTAAVPQGKVVFRDVESNEILGSVNPGADGVAKLDHTFAPVASGQPDQTRQVVAQYAGVDGDIAASTSAPVTVTNTSAPTVFRELGFDVRAQLGVETAQDVPVTINATIVRPAGSVNPSQAMVQLYRGDTPVGAPVALPDGNQMTWTDTVIRQPRTTTQRYRVELVAPVVVDYVKWTSTAPPTGVGDRTRNRPIARPADHRRRQRLTREYFRQLIRVELG